MAAKRPTKKVAKKVAKKRAKKPAWLPFCYTDDLVDALGVSRKTLHKYVQMRLLPAPVLVSDGKSGVRCRWTPIALDHAAFILEQQEIGHTLAEIAAMVAARWGLHDKVQPKTNAPKPVEPGPDGPASPAPTANAGPGEPSSDGAHGDPADPLRSG